MFTPEEKASALAYVKGISHLSKGISTIALLGETRAHDFRPQFVDSLNRAVDVWESATAWFANLSGTIGGDRAAALMRARTEYDKMDAQMPALIDSASIPEMVSVAASWTSAMNAFAAFDWSLAYQDPRHAVNPAMPFHADKTTIGPHGDWARATSVLKYTAEGIGRSVKTFVEVYKTVPIYPAAVNAPFKQQFSRFARIMDLCARVWSMHIEVEADPDRIVIDKDMAKSPTNRGRGFLRTLRQNELLFNNRVSKGSNFGGRPFELGIANELRTLYFQEFIVPLGWANGEAWSYSLVVGDGTGGLFRFHSELTDFWQVMDSWVHAAFGFYHPVPDRNKWAPEQPSPEVVAAQPKIPAGFFDEEDMDIASAKADVVMASERLANILASLRAKEGMPI